MQKRLFFTFSESSSNWVWVYDIYSIFFSTIKIKIKGKIHILPISAYGQIRTWRICVCVCVCQLHRSDSHGHPAESRSAGDSFWDLRVHHEEVSLLSLQPESLAELHKTQPVSQQLLHQGTHAAAPGHAGKWRHWNDTWTVLTIIVSFFFLPSRTNILRKYKRHVHCTQNSQCAFCLEWLLQ